MRKTLSILLAALMLLTLCVPALADETPSAPDIELTEAPAEAEITANDPEAEAGPDRAAMLEERAARREAVKPIAEPNAGSSTVTVSVSIPSGAELNGEVHAYLNRAYETDQTGRITSAARYYYSSFKASGSGPWTVSFTGVEDGEYFLELYVGAAYHSGLMGETLYFNADGSTAESEYCASTFKVTGSTSRSVSIPATERTISGVLRFSAPLERDVTIDCFADSDAGDAYFDAYLRAAKGSSEVPFSLAVGKGQYTLSFSSTSYLYLDYNCELSDSWSSRAHINTLGGDVAGLSISADELLAGQTSSRNYAEVEFTVNFAKPVSDWTELYMFAFSPAGEYVYDYTTDTLEKGESTARFWLELPEGQSFVFGYGDRLYGSFSYNAPAPDVRYAAENGVTTVKASAKVYTIDDDLKITVDEPDYFTITGTLERGGYFAGEALAAYVSASFESGESYGARTYFSAASGRAYYTIRVPVSEDGKAFELTAAPAAETSTRTVEELRTEAVPGTLHGNTAVEAITIGFAGYTVSGTVSIGAPVGKNGGAVRISTYGGITARYKLRPGQEELSFEFTDYSVTTSGYYVAAIYGVDCVMTDIDCYGVKDEATGNYSGLSFNFRKTAVISGTVYLPESLPDVGVNVEIAASCEDQYITAIVTVLKGQRSADYCIVVPTGVITDFSACTQESTGGLVKRERLYINGSWEQGSPETLHVADEGRSGVDFVLQKGIVISGSLVSEDGSDIISLYYKYGDIEILVMSDYSNQYYSAALNEDLTWSTSVDEYMLGDVRICVFISPFSSLNIPTGNYYYTEDGSLTTKISDASVVTLTEDGLSGLDIHVQTGWIVEGDLAAPDGGYLNIDTYWTIGVTLVSESDQYYYGSILFSPGSGPWHYFACVPKEAHSYTFSISMRDSFTDTNIIFSEPFDTGEITGDTDLGTHILSLARAIVSGVIKRPDGFTGGSFFDVYVDMYEQYGATYRAGAYLSEYPGDKDYSSVPFSVLIPEAEKANQYTLTVRSANDELVDFIYVTEDGISTSSQDQAVLTLGENNYFEITAVMKQPSLSGKLYIPDGAEGDIEVAIRLNDRTSWFNFNAEECEEDENGRYFLYSVSSDSNTFSSVIGINVHGVDSLDPSRYYYLNEDGSIASSKTEAHVFEFSGEPLTLDIRIPDAGRICGTLKSEDGDALIIGEKTGVTVYFASGANLQTYQGTVDTDGSWSVDVPQDIIAGAMYAVGVVFYDSQRTNIETNTVFYHTDDGTVFTDSDVVEHYPYLKDVAAGPIDITVRTVWLITGRVAFPEGGYFRREGGYDWDSYDIGVFATNAENDFSYYGRFYMSPESSGPFEYFIHVPKVEADYAISTQYTNVGGEWDTNVAFSQKSLPGTLHVAGSLDVSEVITLDLIRTRISAVFTNLRPTESTYVQFSVITENGQYHAGGSMNSNTNKRELSLAVPEGDGSSTYRVRVNLSSEMIGCFYWLTSDGGLTINEKQAGEFSFSDTDRLEITFGGWDIGSEVYVLQSPHGITKGTYSYSYSVPGATGYDLYFAHPTTEGTITINGKEYNIGSGVNLHVDGESLEISYRVDSAEPIYGFALRYITSDSKLPSVACVYSENYGGDALSALQSGMNTVSADLNWIFSENTVLAAVYDAEGRFLELASGTFVTENGGVARYSFTFEHPEEAASLTVLAANGEWQPLCSSLTLTGTANR